MKAILVVDVPVLDDGRHLCNECQIWNRERMICEYDRNTEHKGCPLKPMPKKTGQESLCRTAQECVNLGWDACIDEIMGGTE